MKKSNWSGKVVIAAALWSLLAGLCCGYLKWQPQPASTFYIVVSPPPPLLHPRFFRRIRWRTLFVKAIIIFIIFVLPMDQPPTDHCWLATLHTIPVSLCEFAWLYMSHIPWWHHQMETLSALLALCAGNSPVTGEFPHKGSDEERWCFLWSAPEQRLSKQSRRRWFETPSRSLWRHCNDKMRTKWKIHHLPTSQYWITQRTTILTSRWRQ